LWHIRFGGLTWHEACSGKFLLRRSLIAGARD
jgi:hypothetical protein